MLLCNIEDVDPGAVLGASVLHPNAAVDMELLKPGVKLDGKLIARLRQLGITQLWIEHDVTKDLDAAVAADLTAAKMSVYRQLRDDLGKMSHQTISIGQVQLYRQSVMELVCQLISNGKFAGMADQLFSSGSSLFTHCSNVAYLAMLIGLELENYIVKERSRLSPHHARDLVPLGLGAMLHDVGKIGSDSRIAGHHEVIGGLEPDDANAYAQHTLAGYQMLRTSRAPASATQAVLNHHQRFDGKGWPDMATVTGKVRLGPQLGKEIHIFTRIVSAANVLDNLLAGAEGARRPPVAALHEFASAKFDGWFDPIVRRAALRRIPPFAIGSKVGLSNGRDAVVVLPNLKHPCRPTVRLLSAQQRSAETATIDLDKEPELRIHNYSGVPVEQWHYELPIIAKPKDQSEPAVAERPAA